MIKYAAGIQYVGSAYSGWQRQKHSASVQQWVETALSKIANEPIETYCAGRTDSGVHAFEQIIHFESKAERSDYAWRMGGNGALPDDIRILWCFPISTEFHARFSAQSRQYRYIIHNAQSDSALLKGRVNWIPYSLDTDSMHQGAQALLGEQDFTSFRAAGCQANTPYRNVSRVSVKRENNFVMVDIEANAFLHHMVRNIVGTLIDVGRQKKPKEWVAELLQLKDRKKAGATARANGLYFMKANYPLSYKIKHLEGARKGLP